MWPEREVLNEHRLRLVPTTSDDRVVAALVAAGPALNPSRAARARMQRRVIAAMRASERPGADRPVTCPSPAAGRLAVSH